MERWRPPPTARWRPDPAPPSLTSTPTQPAPQSVATSGWQGWKENSGQQRAKALLASAARYICFVGGSRSGKTTLFVRAIVFRALAAPHSRHAILRYKANAARTSIIHDTLPKVMREQFPAVKYVEHRQDGFFTLANGSEIWVGGLDEQDRAEKILGNEYVSIFFNECSQIPYSSVVMGLTRLAQVVGNLKQRAYFDLNPVGKGHWTNSLFGLKRDPFSRVPLTNPEEYVREYINPVDNREHLSADYIQSLATLPERQRKRFYEGIYIDELDEALWSYEILERTRDEVSSPRERVNSCTRIVVAIDPSGAASAEDFTRDEIGVIVAGKGSDDHAYVLADRSLRDSPQAWAKVAVQAYHEFKADRIIAEQNFGGEMVRRVIQAVDPNVPISLISASRGKVVRAEPVAALYEQDKVHHVGRFPILEEQLCAFTTSGYRGEGSPDHADALVWALSDLMLEQIEGMGVFEFYRQQYGTDKDRTISLEDAMSKPAEIEPPDFGFYFGEPQKAETVVILRVPAGMSVVFGLSGSVYHPVDGIIAVAGRDAPPLLRNGFVQNE
jgi:phage terminase large subunit-like protein